MVIVIVLALLGIGYFVLTQEQASGNSATAGNYPNYVVALAIAIATAEGFYVSGSRPQRDNNPGDLTVDITGTGVGTDGPLVVYGSADDGWDALYTQVNRYFSGTSAHAGPNSTIADLAPSYTGNDNADSWAANVARVLGVGTDTTIGSLSGS